MSYLKPFSQINTQTFKHSVLICEHGCFFYVLNHCTLTWFSCTVHPWTTWFHNVLHPWFLSGCFRFLSNKACRSVCTLPLPTTWPNADPAPSVNEIKAFIAGLETDSRHVDIGQSLLWSWGKSKYYGAKKKMDRDTEILCVVPESFRWLRRSQIFLQSCTKG